MKTSQNIIQAIAQQIQQSKQQRIPFAEFMALALYHPQFGYYTTRPSTLGPQGDFITSPHMGHDFGEILADQFADMWAVLGHPNPFTLVEMGAGQGLVAADVLSHLQVHYPECFKALHYIVVEKSAALKAEQQNRLSHWQQQGVSLVWQDLSDLASNAASTKIVGCAFSNELVDALPVHWLEVRDQRLQEMWVSADENGFLPVLSDLSSPDLLRYCERIDIDLARYPNGYRTEVNLAALDWLKTVSDCLSRGYILTIDYGYSAQRYYSQARHQGTLQCYYQHAHHNDPFIHVGEQDITAHVDFTTLEAYGREVGLHKIGFTQQGLFLMALGLGDRLAQLSHLTADGSTSNPVATGKTIQATMMRREALQQLISPMGFGNFGILIQSKGLTPTEIARPLKGLTIPPMI